MTQDIPKANEQAFKNLLDDIEFVEREMGSLGLDEAAVGLGQVFGEIKGVSRLIAYVQQILFNSKLDVIVYQPHSERLGAIIRQRSQR